MAWKCLAVGDRATEFGSDLLVEREGVVAIDIDISHGASHTSVIPIVRIVTNMVIGPPPNPSVDRFSVEAPCLPTPEEIEAIIEEARRHARRRRRRNATAAALLALVGVGIAVESSGDGKVQHR